MTELRKIGSKERKTEKLGAAVEYELTHDHMGAHANGDRMSVYIGRSQVAGLQDLLAVAAGEARESMAGQLWDDLMTTYERLTGEFEDLDLPDDASEAHPYFLWGEARGRAQGLALAIAILTNPLRPDVESVRAEALARWEVLE